MPTGLLDDLIAEQQPDTPRKGLLDDLVPEQKDVAAPKTGLLDDLVEPQPQPTPEPPPQPAQPAPELEQPFDTYTAMRAATMPTNLTGQGAPQIPGMGRWEPQPHVLDLEPPITDPSDAASFEMPVGPMEPLGGSIRATKPGIVDKASFAYQQRRQRQNVNERITDAIWSGDAAAYSKALADHEAIKQGGQGAAGYGMAPEGLLEKMVVGSAGQVAPSAVKVAQAGGVGGLVGGGIAGALTLLLGNLGPQAALPEEAVTLPAAIGTGVKLGGGTMAAHALYKEFAGNSYLDMIDSGIEPDTAWQVAQWGAVPMALLELGQIATLTAGLRQGVDQTIRKSATDVVLKALKQYGKTMETEVLKQEIPQRIIETTLKDVGNYLDGKGIKFDKAEAKRRLWDLYWTGVETTQAMAIPAMGGFAADVGGPLRAVVQDKAAQAAIANKQLMAEVDAMHRQLHPERYDTDPAATQQALEAQSITAAPEAAPGVSSETMEARVEELAKDKEVPMSVDKLPKDIAIIQRYMPLQNAAYQSKNADVITATEEILYDSMMMSSESQAMINEFEQHFQALSDEWRPEKGARLVELMDQEITPEQIDAREDISAADKKHIKWLKEVDEWKRTQLIDMKRTQTAGWLGGMNKSELKEEMQAWGVWSDEFEQTWDIWEAHKAEHGLAPKDHAVKLLTETMVPDVWGLQYGHLSHLFFGQYALQYMDENGDPQNIGSAETEHEAYSKLRAWLAVPENKAKSTGVRASLGEVTIPPDMIRVSTKNYRRLIADIKEATKDSEKDIQDWLRGNVGQRRSRKKFYGPLQHRKGVEGYSRDFERIFRADTQAFFRYKWLNQMTRDVTPLIEKLRGQKLEGWADRLQDAHDAAWGTKRSDAARRVDKIIQDIPIVGQHAKPFALERFVGGIKSLNFIRHLQTGRFYVLNSLQTLQTLWPVVGTKGLFKAWKQYYSDEGHELLSKHNVLPTMGKLAERWEWKGKARRYTPAELSERRNQGIAFLGLYDKATNELGMADEAAARYARLRGNMWTQFSYAAADQPSYLRSNIGSLIFQYRRFTLKNLGLAANMLKEGNIGGFGRWLTAQALLGGIQGVPVIAALAGGKALKGARDDIEEVLGSKKLADLFIWGLPSLISLDLSTSVNPADLPFGGNIAERLGNLALGPSGQTGMSIAENIGRTDTLSSVPKVAWETIVDKSPTLKQFKYLLQFLEQDTDVMDPLGKLRYKGELWEILMKVPGFRTLKEGEKTLVSGTIYELTSDEDRTKNLAVRAWVNGDTEEAERILTEWNTMYPEGRITMRDLQSRAKNRRKELEIDQETRRKQRLSRPVRGAAKEYGIEPEPKGPRSRRRPGRPRRPR